MNPRIRARLQKLEHVVRRQDLEHWLRRLLVLFAGCTLLGLLIANIVILWASDSQSVLFAEWLPSASGAGEQQVGRHVWKKSQEPAAWKVIPDEHPVRELMHQADIAFQQYDGDRSKTLRETVEKYRKAHGRHPPPGFNDWYKFARQRKVHNIDDFQQIHDDLRPFWGIPPAEIRRYAAHASDDFGHAVSTISLRDGQVFQETWGSWRSETFIHMLATVAQWLPDMDIPMNRMDQPRVIVPFEKIQAYLAIEESTRSLRTENVVDGFTRNQSNLWSPRPVPPEPGWLQRWNPFWMPHDHQVLAEDPHPPYGWFPYQGQQYMDLASQACPPESYARNANSTAHYDTVEASYKHQLGGIVTNFNLSSDLCTVGPQISRLHGLLYASTSMLATQNLVPIFGECKVNVNNDILFPANMYWKHDPRYEFDDEQDINWDDKDDVVVWRGVTSGGTAFENEPQPWRQMHRQRLVLMTNATELGDKDEAILALDASSAQAGSYSKAHFKPAAFASKHTDIGFTEKTSCIPNCDFYNHSLTMVNQTTFSDTFRNKYLIDVDGMSFSGRWRAFLQSRSLGLKATIFREWHDSRLWAWRHFVPLDNRYDDLYSMLTYFIGTEQQGVKVQRHDYEAYKLARQGREYAAKVLRREDIEIYVFRLLLEYGRVVDDNRDSIGFVGDGGEEMERFDREFPAME